MNYILSKEKHIVIAPACILLFIFFVPLSPSLKSIMAVLSLAAIFLTPYYRKYLPQTFNTWWGWSAVALFAYVILASAWSDAPYSMRLGVIDKYSKLIYLPVLTVGFIHPKTRRWVFNSYFAIMLVTCIISFLKQEGFISLKNMSDTGEVFHNHIATGFMVALAVYFAAVLLFDSQVSKWQRAYYWLMILIGSYQIFFLNTGRTGYFTYGLLMILFMLQKFSLKKALIGMLLFSSAVAAVYTLSPLMQARIASLVSDIQFMKHDEKNTSLGFRVQFHQYARSLFTQHPLIGMGTGSFKYHFAQDNPIPAWGDNLNDPHSQYWLTLSEQGMIGLLLLLVFIGTLFLGLLQVSKQTRPILLGVLVSFCFGSLGDSILCYSTAGTLLVIFFAMGFGELLEKANLKQHLSS